MNRTYHKIWSCYHTSLQAKTFKACLTLIFLMICGGFCLTQDAYSETAQQSSCAQFHISGWIPQLCTAWSALQSMTSEFDLCTAEDDLCTVEGQVSQCRGHFPTVKSSSSTVRGQCSTVQRSQPGSVVWNCENCPCQFPDVHKHFITIIIYSYSCDISWR